VQSTALLSLAQDLSLLKLESDSILGISQGVFNMAISSNKKIIPILFIIVIVLGVFFRGANLSQKPYWLDETYTLLRSSGYTAQEATQRLFNGQLIRVEDILQYQYPSAQDGGTAGTIAGLAMEEPQHPPLFFLLARGWGQLFGHSKLSMRSLSVLGSLLTLPAIYWFCLELSVSPLVGLLTMALVAISPIQIRYAQEVRQYSLWLAVVLLSCAVILRAIRQPTKLSWGIYSLTIAVGFYCHLLTGLVVIAHGIYLVVRERLHLTKSFVAYLSSAAIAVVAALPWFWIVWQNSNTVTRTLEHFTHPLPFWSLFQAWSLSLNRLWLAWHFQYNSVLIYLTAPILCLIIYAFYFFCRHTSWQTWTFILILLGTLFLPFLIPDLIWGGRRSTSERYFLLCYVIIDLIVAYLLVAKLTQPFRHMVKHKFWVKYQFWRAITATVLTGSIISCLLGVFSPTWWGWSEFDVKIAQITNAAPHPLIITDAAFSAIVPLCHELKQDTKMILLQEPDLLQIPDNFSHVFLYNPGERLLFTLKQQNAESNLIYQFRDPTTKLIISLYQINLDSTDAQKGALRSA
jgi:uncharacterized membrane protein